MKDAEYNAIKAEIVQLQNENYADPQAADLQARLGDIVLQEYYDSLGIILEGEVIEDKELTAGENE